MKKIVPLHILTLLVILSAGLLVSCMTPQKLPRDHFYRLSSSPAEQHPQPLFTGVVGVEEIRTDGILNERSILYIHTSNPLEIQRAQYHHWQEQPSSLIQKNMIAFLDTTKAVRQVVLYEPGVEVDQRISGHLLVFEREIGESTTSVNVVLELSLSSSGNRNSATRTYRQRVTCQDNSIEAAADSFGTALSQIYRRFMDDITSNRLK